MAWKDLRLFLEKLEEMGDLVRIKDPFSTRYEIVGLTRQAADADGPALLFENVKESEFPVLSNLYGSKRRIALALGVPEEELFRYYLEHEEDYIEPRIVDEGPCQEIVLTGDEVDLRKLPILLHYEKDCGPYITAGIQIAKHPDTGQRNVSIHRLLLLDKNLVTVYAPPGRHLARIIQRNEDFGRGTPIATAIGVDPIIGIASQARVPMGYDEFAVAGGLGREPVELVRCKTIPVEVPAYSEIVLEGETIPGERVPDGPFGEYPGTYSPVKQAPVMRIKAITMRRRAIYQNALTGMPMTENHWMMQPAATAMVYREAHKICPEVKAVNVTPGGTCRHHVIISIKKRHAYEARNLILGLLAGPLGAKHVVVVDEDIDVFNMLQVEWAINTRVQPDKDVIIIPELYSPTLDPSAPIERATAKMGIDATAPLGRLQDFQPPRVPGIEKLDLSKYWSPATAAGKGGRP